MKRVLTAALLLLLGLSAAAQTTTAPTLLNFQGRLAKPDGTPLPDGNYAVTFSLWDDPTATGSTHLRWTQTVSSVTAHNGVFAALLGNSNPINDAVLNGTVYLQVQIGSNAPLTPRQMLVSVAYAIKANTVPDASITGAKIVTGTITGDKLAPNVLGSQGWLLGGNSGTNPPTNFLGTTDSKPLVLKSNNYRAMQMQYAKYLYDATNGYYLESVNILGGYSGNTLGSKITGATVFGGYVDSQYGSYPNNALSSGSTVGGGLGNTAGVVVVGQYDGLAATVAGGFLNTAGGYASVVAGGRENQATNIQGAVLGGYQNVNNGYSSAIGGGEHNSVTGTDAFVGGGNTNSAGGDFNTIGGGNLNSTAGLGATVGGGQANFAGTDMATVAGGNGNFAHGFAAFIAGGSNNEAAGDNSFAGGRQAQANTTGSFVWADNHAANFTATVDNSFIVRAAGGVGINTASPGTGFALDVNGLIRTTGAINTMSDARFKTHVTSLDHALDDVLMLRGVTYEWNNAAWPDRHFGDGRQIGFIAQEVERVFPELVSKDEKGYRSVAYSNLVPVLVEAVKAQQKQIDALKADNAELKKQNAEIAALKAQIAALADLMKQQNRQK